jgi:hypothetical protein
MHEIAVREGRAQTIAEVRRNKIRAAMSQRGQSLQVVAR